MLGKGVYCILNVIIKLKEGNRAINELKGAICNGMKLFHFLTARTLPINQAPSSGDYINYTQCCKRI